MAQFDYRPPVTLRNYMNDMSLARFVIGPLGSAKTTCNIMELTRRMAEQAPDANGIRPTRFAVIRNTLPQLKQTVLPDIQQLLGPLLTYKVAESTLHFNFKLADGTTVKSEWLFVPLDSKEDTRRLLSLQLTGAWISEFREVNYEIVAAVLGRVGRYPSPMRVLPTWQGIIAESNPFSEGSPWYDHLVLDLPSHWSFFKQPGGLEPKAENVKNLPDQYYARLIEGNSEEWVNVHVHGQFGDDMSGQAVFGRSFTTEFHVRDGLIPNHTSKIILGCDWGRTPACLVGQVDARGRLLIFREITGENVGVEKFMKEQVTPVLANDFTHCHNYIVGDPAGVQKSQVGEESVFDTLLRLGFDAYPAPTNNIDSRLRAVEKLLLAQTDGEASVLINREGCPLLIRALQHEYMYRRKKTGDVDDKPDKSHPWSDLADALQYMCLSVGNTYIARRLRPRAMRRGPKFDKRAWT